MRSPAATLMSPLPPLAPLPLSNVAVIVRCPLGNRSLDHSRFRLKDPASAFRFLRFVRQRPGQALHNVLHGLSKTVHEADNAAACIQGPRQKDWQNRVFHVACYTDTSRLLGCIHGPIEGSQPAVSGRHSTSGRSAPASARKRSFASFEPSLNIPRLRRAGVHGRHQKSGLFAFGSAAPG